MNVKKVYYVILHFFVVYILLRLYISHQVWKENPIIMYFKENNISQTKIYFNKTKTNKTISTTNKTIFYKKEEIRMKDILLFGKNNTFSNSIPMIIHYNYKGNLLPSQYIPLVKKCIEINPKVKFVYWNDSAAHNLIKNYFPNNLNTYQSFLQKNTEPLKKSDIMRYFVLYLFGGIYMDLDTRCQRPMEEAMKGESCTLSKEAEVQTRILWNMNYITQNSFMACIPNHEFFKFVINNIRKNDNSGAVWNTGPMFLTPLFQKFTSTLNNTANESRYTFVSASSSDKFMPFIESYLENSCHNPSGEWRIKGCKDLPAYRKIQNELISNATVVHLFSHLGSASGIKSWGDVSTVRALFLAV